jgi:hypothetical protein
MKPILKYVLVLLLLIIFTFNLVPVLAAPEIPSNIYMGNGETAQILKNIEFHDVESKGENFWARNAIYDMAALSIIKGYGENYFNGSAPVTRVQALALIYRAIGKEKEALEAAKIIEQQRDQEGRINTIEAWANGYLQLAVNDGLITPQQFSDALAYDQSALEHDKSFVKTAPAQRQEIGEWMAKLLGLTPIAHDRQTALNYFNDRNEIDPSKAPYLEALVREKIMNGNNGFLYPAKGISREEMVQVLKNAERFILERQGLALKYGYIEEIQTTTQPQIANVLKTVLIKIRNIDGKQDHILLEKICDFQGNNLTQQDIIVLGRGKPADSSRLKEKDEISYIIDKQNHVRMIKITGTVQNTIAEIENYPIVRIYKANIYVYDEYNSKLIVSKLNKLEEERWNPLIDKQFTEVAIGGQIAVYGDGRLRSLSYINSNYTDCPVYIAVTQGNDGTEKAVFLSVKNIDHNTEDGYSDSVKSVEADTRKIHGENKTFQYNEDTIILKNGKLVTADKLAAGDKMYIVAGENDNPEEPTAHIIQVQEKTAASKENVKKK